jgi:hypothetical protein
VHNTLLAFRRIFDGFRPVLDNIQASNVNASNNTFVLDSSTPLLKQQRSPMFSMKLLLEDQ